MAKSAPRKDTTLEAAAKEAATEENATVYWRPGRARLSRLDTDPTLSDRIFALVEAGASIPNAHVAAGVPHDTAKDWAKYAKAGKEPYATHYDNLQTAKAIFRSQLEIAWGAAALGKRKGVNVNAVIALLERRYSDEFYIPRKIEVTGANGSDFNASIASMEQLKEVLRSIDANNFVPPPKPPTTDPQPPKDPEDPKP